MIARREDKLTEAAARRAGADAAGRRAPEIAG